MSIVIVAIALSTLVLWTAGQRTDAQAAEAWAALVQGGITNVPLLPAKTAWVKALTPLEGGDAWTMDKIAQALGPLGIFAAAVAGNEEAKKEVTEAAQTAKKLAEDKIDEVKTGYGILIGLGAAFLIGGAIAVGVVVHQHRKKALARAA